MNLQKYQYYLGLGGVLVLYLLLYFFFVRPYGADVKKNLGGLTAQKKTIDEYNKRKDKLPNDRVIKYHQEQKEKLDKTIQDAYDFYKKKDEEYLERWFKKIEEDLSKTGKKLPELYVFQPAYENEKKRLVKEYSDKKEGLRVEKETKKGKTGDEFPETTKSKISEIEEILPFVTAKEDIVTNPQMKTVQKQFWVIEYFLKILEKGKMRTLARYKFLNDWQEGPEKKLFDRRSIELYGQVNYEDIPGLIREILHNPYLMTQITKMSVERDRVYKPETIPITIPWGPEKVEEREKKATEEYFKKNPEKGRLPGVWITIQCDILDYRGEPK
jgi:hypothetical protein